MHAEIIAIGAELTSGQSLDTNSQWLSRSLGDLGIPVRFHTTIGDDLAENVAAFRIAAGRAGLIVCTGGLGPTQDDLTRDALAAVAGVGLVEHAPSLAWIASMFERRGRAMTDRNRVQALFPEGSEPLANAIGTAPGIGMRLGSALVACLPGVPREMKRMFEAEVVPWLGRSGVATRAIVHRKINLFGKGESDVEADAMDLTERGRVPEVGITASETTISFRVSAEGATYEEARAATEPTVALILDRFAELYVGEGAADVADATVAELARTGRTLATIEVGTGGMIALQLGAVPGSSDHCLGGLVAPSARAARSWLGSEPGSIADGPAPAVQLVSTVRLAHAARERAGADLGLAVLGPIEAGPGIEADRVGDAWITLVAEGLSESRHLRLGHEQPREVCQKRAAKLALNLARLALRPLPARPDPA